MSRRTEIIDFIHALREEDKDWLFEGNSTKFDNECNEYCHLDDIEKYKLLFDNASDVIIVLDLNGNFIDFNKKFEMETLYSKNEMIRKNVFTSGIITKDSSQKIAVIIQSLVDGNPIPVIEVECVTKKGDITSYELRVVPLYMNNKLIAVQATLRNVSDWKKFEKLIRESEKKYRILIESLNAGIWKIDKEAKTTFANDHMADILGYSADEMIGKSLFDFMDDEGRRIAEEKLEKRRKGISDHHDFEFIRKDGTRVYTSLETSPIFDESGRYQGALAGVIDISDRRKAEERFQKIFDISSDLVCEADITTSTFTNVNPAFMTLLGYSREELLSHSFLDFIHPDDKEKTIRVIKEELQQGKSVISFINQFRCKDGSYVLLEWNSHPVPRDGVTYAIARNITEQKKAQDELAESKKRLDLALKGGDLGTWDWNIITNEVYFNKRWAEMKGYVINEIKPHLSTWEQLVHPDDLPAVRRILNDHLNGKTPFYKAEFRMQHKSGEWIWILDKGKVIEWDQQGNPVRACGTHMDITEQKKAEEKIKLNEAKLRESEHQLKEAQKIAKMGRWDYYHSDNQLTWTETIFEIFETDSKKFKVNYESFLSMVHPDDRCAVNEAWENSLKNREPYVIDHRLLLKDNRIKWVREECKTIFNEQGNPVHSIGIVQDITDYKKMEDELQEAYQTLKELNMNLETKVEERTKRIHKLLKQKDDFINQLGHDLKNPLGPFVHLLPVLKEHVSAEKDKEIINVLDRNAKYMRNLVKKTIDLAKLSSEKSNFNFKMMNLSDIVEEVISVNHSFFDKNDIIIENFVSSDCSVFIDHLHVQELLTNLFNNAVKYTEGSGKITIDAKPVGDCVLVSIKDTGSGISSNHLEYLFDEYYKVDGSRHDFESSGLGLSICKKIVERHGGRIWAESEGIGMGSTFYFTLPTNNA